MSSKTSKENFVMTATANRSKQTITQYLRLAQKQNLVPRFTFSYTPVIFHDKYHKIKSIQMITRALLCIMHEIFGWTLCEHFMDNNESSHST